MFASAQTFFAEAAEVLRTLPDGKKALFRARDGDARCLAAIADVARKGVTLPPPVVAVLDGDVTPVPGAMDLLRALLHPVPTNRPPMAVRPGSDIAKAAFFKGCDWDALHSGALFPPFVPPPARMPQQWKDSQTMIIKYVSLLWENAPSHARRC